MGFRTKITIFLVASMVFVGAISSSLVYITYRTTLQKSIIQNIRFRAAGIMNMIDRSLQHRLAIVRIITSDPIIRSPDSTIVDITRKLLEYRNVTSSFISVSMFDIDGVRISDTSGLDIRRRRPETAPWLGSAKETLAIAVGKSSSLGQIVIYFAGPIKDNQGAVIGSIVARMPIERLYELTEQLTMYHGEMIHIDLVDQEGLLLYSNHNRKGVLSDTLHIREVDRSLADERMGSGIITRTGSADVIFVAVRERGYLDFRGNNWKLIARVSTITAFAPANVLRNRLIFLLFGIGLSVVLLGIYFVRQVTMPIKKLTEGAHLIGTGNYEHRIDVGSKDEIGALARSFNDMSENLRRSRNDIRAVVDNIVDGLITISERGIILSVNPAAQKIFRYSEAELVGRNVNILAAEPDRSAHNDYLENYLKSGTSKILNRMREVTGERRDGVTFPMELTITRIDTDSEMIILGIVRDITERKEMDRMKSEFVSTVSHELRTPLTSIRGALGMLQGGVAGELPPKAAKMIGIAAHNSDRLVRLINDILDMEKIESGKLVMNLEQIDLVPLVEAAIEDNRGYAQQFKVDFQFVSHPPHARVRGDADRLTQVVTNLLSNAVKFSPGEGKVWVEIAQIGDRIRVAVSDQGPGVSQEFQSLIFQKFAQADSSDTRQKGGTGLGLNISKAIVEKHGGTIGFDTEIGKGATFFFELPAWKEERTGPARVQVRIAAERGLICENNPDFAHLLTLLYRASRIPSRRSA